MVEALSLKKVVMNRKWLHVILFIGMAVLLLNPIGLPIVINTWTQALYDYIDSVPEGSTVLVVPDFEAAAYSESGPTMEATLKHFFSRNIKCVIVGFYIDAPMMTIKVLDAISTSQAFQGKIYGEDYTVLPIVMGGTAGAASLARDFRGMFEVDNFGDPLADQSIFDGLYDANDFTMTIAYGSEGAGGFLVSQWYIPFGVPHGSCSGALGLTGVITSFQAGLNVGGAVGIRGGAEYELLTGWPGAALSQMDTINAAHLIAVIVIIGVNINYAYEKITGSNTKSKGGNT